MWWCRRGFQFEYVRSGGAEEGGIVLKSTKVYGDTAAVLGRMLKRGLVEPEDLMMEGRGGCCEDSRGVEIVLAHWTR